MYELSCHKDCRQWFKDLDPQAAKKVSTAVKRLEAGNTSNCKSLGAGVHELKIDWGPGYRVYFSYTGQKGIALLRGGTKQRQQNDIDTAKVINADRKRGNNGAYTKF